MAVSTSGGEQVTGAGVCVVSRCAPVSRRSAPRGHHRVREHGARPHLPRGPGHRRPAPVRPRDVRHARGRGRHQRRSVNEGESLRLGRLDRKGDYFGEAALLGRGERTATVTAETDVTAARAREAPLRSIVSPPPLGARSPRGRLPRARDRDVHAHPPLPRQARRSDTRRARQGREAQAVPARAMRSRRSATPRTTVLVIKDGVVKATRASAKGGVSILAYFNTHDVVGSADGVKREYGLEAVGQCEMIYLPRAAFTMAMARRPDVAEHFKKDDMSRRDALDKVGGTMIKVVDDFLKAGVEVESLLVINLDRCVRCGNCVRACHSRHEYTRLDRRGPIFRRRTKAGAGHHEHLMLPASCRHCRDPGVHDRLPDRRDPARGVRRRRHQQQLHRLRELRAQVPVRQYHDAPARRKRPPEPRGHEARDQVQPVPRLLVLELRARVPARRAAARRSAALLRGARARHGSRAEGRDRVDAQRGQAGRPARHEAADPPSLDVVHPGELHPRLRC